MEIFLELGDLFRRIGIAGSTDAICTLIKQYATRFGLTRMSFLSLTNRARGFNDATICSDASHVFISAFNEIGAFANHPLVKRSRATTEPFAISSVTGGIGIDHKRCRSFGDTAPTKIDGLIVPVYQNGKPAALAAFVGAAPTLQRIAFDTLKLAVQAGWERSRELSSETDVSNDILTAREFEVLRWVALGKTDREIGKILAIAPRTVRFHVDNAKEKLGVATRIQAVARMLRGGTR